MKIREAKEQDIEQIKTLIDKSIDEVISKYHSAPICEKFKAHNSTESLLHQLKWKKVYVVEDDNGDVIATGAFANFGSVENPKYCVSNFYVLPAKHSNGIGRMLFDKLLQDAKSNCANSFHVPSSKNAVGFYKKMGFAVDDQQSDQADEITWMTMPL